VESLNGDYLIATRNGEFGVSGVTFGAFGSPKSGERKAGKKVASTDCGRRRRSLWGRPQWSTES